MPRLDAATTAADWPDLVAELDRWGEAGRVANLWWRDDDAVGGSPKLTNMLRLAGTAPLALAVIPALVQPDLVEALHGARSIAVLQHGWRHVDWAEHGRKTEYPDERPRAIVAAELVEGRTRLTRLFGSRAVPVFVPPWNRFAPALFPVLAENGTVALSALASPRRPAALPAGLRSIDVHVDVTDWRGDRGFVGTPAALARLIFWLRTDRLARPAAAGPIGILTHHLSADDATAAFLSCLAETIDGHAAARWTHLAEHLR